MNNLPNDVQNTGGQQEQVPAPPGTMPPVYGPPMPYPAYQPPRPRPAPVFTRADRAAAWISLLLGLLVMRYFFWNPSGFATTVSIWFCLGLALWYMLRRGFKLSKMNWINTAVILIFSFTFSFTADRFIMLFNFALIIAASAYLVFSVSSGRRFSESFARDQMGALIFPFWGFGYNFRAMGAKIEGEKSKSRNGLYILLGLLAGIPLFAVVTVALISSDQAMAKIMEDIGTYFFDDVLTIGFQLAFGIPVAMYIFGMLYINGSDRLKDQVSDETYARKSASGRILPPAAVYAVLSPILVLYAVYFVSQLPYFLSGFSGNLPNGFTYARYAREGFGSLVFLTALNLAIIMVTQRFTRGTGGQKSPLLKGYTVIFSLSTLVLVGSAFSKLFMYIGEYGLTRLRVFSAWAIALISIIFILIIVRQFWKKLPLMRFAVAVGVVMFGLLAFSRMDYQIARYNIEMYKNGNHKELDAYYLIYNLSDDGLLYILENDEIDTLQTALEKEWNRLYTKGDDGLWYDSYDEYDGDEDEKRVVQYEVYLDSAEELIKSQLCWGGGMLSDSTAERMRYYNFSSMRLRRLAEVKWGAMSTWDLSTGYYE